MIDEADNIYLAKAVLKPGIRRIADPAKSGTYKNIYYPEVHFEIIEVIKGDSQLIGRLTYSAFQTPNVDQLNIPSPDDASDSETDFDRHTAPEFWGENGGRMMLGTSRKYGLCHHYFTFKTGETYLLIPEGLEHVKGAEIIRTEDDAWLAYVKARVKANRTPKPKPKPKPDISHPFVGCWQSESGLTVEEWMLAPNGWLIGYAMNLNKDGEMVFFEQMRIERDGEKEVLFVTGGEDVTPVPFTHQPTGSPNIFRFVNSEHDHPQVITYRRAGNKLDAEIARLDGTSVVEFPKTECE